MRKGRATEGDIIAFIRHFHAIEQKVGIARIEQKLQELYSAEVGNKPSIIKNRILEEITRAYGIPSRTILQSTKRGNATQARVMAIILFYKHLTLSKSEIATIFGHCQPNIVSLRLKTFANFYCNIPAYENERRFEKVYSPDFMKKYNELDATITEFKNSQMDPPKDWKKW